MKNKKKFLITGMLITIFAIFSFCGLFYFLDTVFDRKMGDLFEKLFMIDMVYNFREDGTAQTFPMLRWTTLKTTFLVACIRELAEDGYASLYPLFYPFWWVRTNKK